MSLASTKVKVPKIVYAAGTKTLYPNITPVRLSPHNKKVLRFDEFSTAGKRQSVFQRTDDMLELEFRFINNIQLITQTESFELPPWQSSVDVKIGKNYLFRSDEFDSSLVWVASGTPSSPVVTPNDTKGPDGLTTADKVVFPTTGVGESSTLLQVVDIDLPLSGVIADQSFTFSVYIRGDIAGNIVLQLNGSTPFEAGISTGQPYTTDWQRFFVTHTFPGGSTSTKLGIGFVQGASTATQTLFLAGAQLEYGKVPSDYTATAATAQTLLIADPFFEELTAAVSPALPELINALPKRGRQIVITKTSGGNNFIHDVVGKTLYNLRNEAVTYSAWFKRQDTSPPLFNFNISDGLDVQRVGENFSITITPTASWVRFHNTVHFQPGNAGDLYKVRNFVHNAIGTYYAFGFNLTVSTGPLPYQVAGDVGVPLDAWEDFYADALQGNTFDYYPDAWDTGFTTYHLVDKAFKPRFMMKGHYEVRLKARKEL